MTVHLRMTGQLLLVSDKFHRSGPYTRLAMELDDGRILRFDDQRKFGRIRWFPNEAALNESLVLGPDPTGDEFRVDDLATLLAGVGVQLNPYSSTNRFWPGLETSMQMKPCFVPVFYQLALSIKLTLQEIKQLWSAIRDVLHEGITYRGTSMRDYVDSDGREGETQKRLRVYGREGKPCFNCGRPLARAKVAGRSSFHCLDCQT